MTVTIALKREEPRDVLSYEMWMLHRSQEQIAAWDKVSFKKRSEESLAIYCSVLEAFLVHARSLLTFFYNRPDPRFPDDLIAEVFPLARRWQRRNTPTKVTRWLRLINKRLQHMTTSRWLPREEWSEQTIRTHIDVLFAELNRCGPVGGPVAVRHPART